MNSSKKTKGRPAAGGGDWIHLRRMQVNCVLGVHPSERVQKRVVWLDISLECDTRPAARTDELNDALNYELIEAEVVALAKKARYRLVESLAALVAEACLDYPQVQSVRVVVEKPGALPLTQSVAVEIVRRKR
jgi:7,8-dihydroneopterin aldolase/epimerase/oxygenase